LELAAQNFPDSCGNGVGVGPCRTMLEVGASTGTASKAWVQTDMWLKKVVDVRRRTKGRDCT
jgi:hypothetical protein